MSIEDAGVTEAWLRVSMPDTVSERMFTLLRDGVPVDTSVLTTADTVIVDEGLLPNQQYTYKAFRTSDSEILDSTVIVQATTMDTTSHDVVWEAFAFGDYSTSGCGDVALLDESDIWVVGEFFLNDSSGNQDPDSYNAFHWDGQGWEALKILFPLCGTMSVYSPLLTSVWANSPSDVWFTDGGNFVHWDGTSFQMICLPPDIVTGLLKEIWAASPTELYAVGRLGTIVRFDGTDWENIESGTDLAINDIWGDTDTTTGEGTILCIASDITTGNGRKLLEIGGSSVTALPDSGLSLALSAIWFQPDRRYYIGGDGIFISRSIGPVWVRDSTFPPYYKTAIRGTGLNDVVVAGVFGLLAHYNGQTWRNYQSEMPSGGFTSVAVKEGLIVAVGGNGSQGLVVFGRRL